MTDLNYDPSSLCGPIDRRVVRCLERVWGHALDRPFLRHAERHHGGVPGKQYFDAEDGNTYRVGRFLTLVDGQSELRPPSRPSLEGPERDARIDWSILTVAHQEGPSCRHLLGLLPFAALYFGDAHPDGELLTEAHVDLLCFTRGQARQRSPVVVWLAHKARREYWRWKQTGEGRGAVRYEDFTVPVAPTFSAFLRLPRRKP